MNTKLVSTVMALSMLLANVAHAQSLTPTVTTISPSIVATGSANTTLTVHGSDFMQSSIVYVNGSPRTTTYHSSTQLTANIPASDLAAAGTLAIRVSNPVDGGGLSNQLNLTVQNTVPVIPVVTSLSPSSAVVGGSAFILTVNGLNFTSDSEVLFNGLERTTTFVSPTVLRATILASDLSVANNQAVQVRTPDVGTSNSLLFQITGQPGNVPNTPNTPNVPVLPNTGFGPNEDSQAMNAIALGLAALLMVSLAAVPAARAWRKVS